MAAVTQIGPAAYLVDARLKRNGKQFRCSTSKAPLFRRGLSYFCHSTGEPTGDTHMS